MDSRNRFGITAGRAKTAAAVLAIAALGGASGAAISGCGDDNNDSASDSLKSVTEQINSIATSVQQKTQSVKQQTESIKQPVPTTGGGNSGGSGGY